MKLSATTETGRRPTGRTTRRLQGTLAVALAITGTLVASGPGRAAANEDTNGSVTEGTTALDHFPGVSGTVAGASSPCDRATNGVVATVTINGVEFEIDHFPGPPGSPAGSQGTCTP